MSENNCLYHGAKQEGGRQAENHRAALQSLHLSSVYLSIFLSILPQYDAKPVSLPKVDTEPDMFLKSLTEFPLGLRDLTLLFLPIPSLPHPRKPI